MVAEPLAADQLIFVLPDPRPRLSCNLPSGRTCTLRRCLDDGTQCIKQLASVGTGGPLKRKPAFGTKPGKSVYRMTCHCPFQGRGRIPQPLQYFNRRRVAPSVDTAPLAVTVTPLADAEAEETLPEAEREITVELAEGWADVLLAGMVELQSQSWSRGWNSLVRGISRHVTVLTVVFILIRVILTVVLLANARGTGGRSHGSLRCRGRG